VDERLIHGQVVLGWGRRLHPTRYLVVDDELAASDWEQDLYRLSVEASVEVRFLTAEEAVEQLPDLQGDEVPTVLLTRDLEHMLRLARAGVLVGAEVNLGGIHHRADRAEVRPYIHLSDEERDQLRALGETGVTVTARDLPETMRVPLASLLAEGAS
jgi:PTS system mannose-specific IIB component/fructoselysine and glucoselysine-specific PTS system IIB component